MVVRAQVPLTSGDEYAQLLQEQEARKDVSRKRDRERHRNRARLLKEHDAGRSIGEKGFMNDAVTVETASNISESLEQVRTQESMEPHVLTDREKEELSNKLQTLWKNDTFRNDVVSRSWNTHKEDIRKQVAERIKTKWEKPFAKPTAKRRVAQQRTDHMVSKIRHTRRASKTPEDVLSSVDSIVVEPCGPESEFTERVDHKKSKRKRKPSARRASWSLDFETEFASNDGPESESMERVNHKKSKRKRKPSARRASQTLDFETEFASNERSPDGLLESFFGY